MKETTIKRYLTTHGCCDNIVYTWIVWNFDELDRIGLWNEDRKFKSNDIFNVIEQRAYSDKFVAMITNNGKYRANEPNIVDYRPNNNNGKVIQTEWEEP